jgi:cytochrome c biogenesis protein CcdA
MTVILEKLSGIINTNIWLAPLFSLIAGVLTSFTPCSLSSIPLIIGYVGGTNEKSTKKALQLSLIFALGSALTFTVFGVVASLAGKLIGASTKWVYLILGILMILMALQTWGIFEIIPSSYLVSKNKKKGYIGAFTAGILAGIFASPCSTPVLIALLAIIAGRGKLLWGILLMLLYSIGYSILSVIAGTFMGFAQKITTDKKYGKFSLILKIVLGTAILLFGFYMLYIGF